MVWHGLACCGMVWHGVGVAARYTYFRFPWPLTVVVVVALCNALLIDGQHIYMLSLFACFFSAFYFQYLCRCLCVCVCVSVRRFIDAALQLALLCPTA